MDPTLGLHPHDALDDPAGGSVDAWRRAARGRRAAGDAGAWAEAVGEVHVRLPAAARRAELAAFVATPGIDFSEVISRALELADGLAEPARTEALTAVLAALPTTGEHLALPGELGLVDLVAEAARALCRPLREVLEAGWQTSEARRVRRRLVEHLAALRG